MSLEAKVCPNCGSNDINEQLKCIYCGSQLSYSSNGVLSLAGITRGCAGCGYQNSPGTRFCGKCGKSLVRECTVCRKEHPVELLFCPQKGINIDKYPHFQELLSKIKGKESNMLRLFNNYKEVKSKLNELTLANSEESRRKEIMYYQDSVTNSKKRIAEIQKKYKNDYRVKECPVVKSIFLLVSGSVSFFISEVFWILCGNNFTPDLCGTIGALFAFYGVFAFLGGIAFLIKTMLNLKFYLEARKERNNSINYEGKNINKQEESIKSIEQDIRCGREKFATRPLEEEIEKIIETLKKEMKEFNREKEEVYKSGKEACCEKEIYFSISQELINLAGR